MATLNPRSLSIRPVAAAVTPLPTDDTTPPVKNRYFVVIEHLLGGRSPWHWVTRGPGSTIKAMGRAVWPSPSGNLMPKVGNRSGSSSHQFRHVIGCAPHFQEYQAQLGFWPGQGSQHGSQRRQTSAGRRQCRL